MGEGFPLCSLAPMAWEGQEPLRDWIYLSVSAFWNSAPAPFPLYLEIRNSNWIETFAQIVFQKLAFLRPKKGINRLTGGPREWWRAHLEWWCGPLLWPPRAPFRVDSSSQKSQIFQNNSPSIFIPFRYWVSAKYKTCNKQELSLSAG